MSQPNRTGFPPLRLRRFRWMAAGAWTVVVAGLLAWGMLYERRSTHETAQAQARSAFNRDQAFRLWGTLHGGVYVPATERTPPNPYLDHVPERDIVTPSGKTLTLMNPAYMVRQMNEEFANYFGIFGRITSLKPLRPENAPDTWERKALEAFERGESEKAEFTEIDGQPYLRLMRPMFTREGCLKCHGHQGYQVDDVRGGVGVSLPMASLQAAQYQEIAVQAVSLGILWLLGLVGITFGSQRIQARVREHQQAGVGLPSSPDADERPEARGEGS